MERSVSSKVEKVVMKRSVSKAEDEGNSRSWMQMVVEAKMLEAVLRAMEQMEESTSAEPEEKVVEGSTLAEKEEETQLQGSSWVVEMKKILEHTDPWVEKARWEKPSIYRVPEWLKNLTKAEVYRPQVVSLGPFHHGELCLLPMEQHKRRLMLHMVKRSKIPLAMFVEAITKVANKLQDAYDGLGEKWRGDNTGRFVEVMVTDGGFLLEFLTMVTPTDVQGDYARFDPIFSMHSALSLWARIHSDMILVENQVPLLALQTLEAVRSRTFTSQDAYINKLVTDFLCPKLSRGISVMEDKLGLHPLEMFHRSFCGLSKPVTLSRQVLEQCEYTRIPSAVELREAGVHFKRSDTQSVEDIDFKDGVLSMPLVKIEDSSETEFFNLMAFERLHGNAGSAATAYMIFMDNIIDSERDVALLRSRGILKNFLSSDKEAADLFNTLGKGATMNPSSKVHLVRWLVAKHCAEPWPKLQASFKHTYLRNPWVFISAVAAITLLALTILQTIYTIVPFYTKN